jgi:site-specific DNA-methyltransferase (adenine-specific)
MSFYIQMTTLELFNADCLEQMKSIPDKSIDLIICDLPYGCLSIPGRKVKRGIDGFSSGGKAMSACEWDVKIDLDAFWKQIKRIRKDDRSACLHFCSTRFGVDLINSNPKEFRYDLVWNKQRGVSFLSANKKPMASHEMIYVFSKKGANYNRIDIEGESYIHKKSKSKTKYINKQNTLTNNIGTRCSLSVIDECSFAKKDQHPTAKPIDLYKWLIERYSKEGDKVLDPTFGSGNSGLVCKELNRNYIGIEMNKEFYDKAHAKLISTTTSSADLLDPSCNTVHVS